MCIRDSDRTIDYTLAAKEYPTEYATYKAVLDKSGYDSPEEYKARTVYYDHITSKAIAADATAAQKDVYKRQGEFLAFSYL